MKYKLLGRSGMRVSELCLGTMTFGADAFGAPQEECQKVFDAFVDAGGNFFDTANMYSQGNSERILGEFIAHDRARFVIATKYTHNMRADDANAGGNQRKNLVQALDASLKRLGTDYVDLLWVHSWDFTTPIGEVMRSLDDMVRAGKVLHLGISNAPAWVVASANVLAQERGWTPFCAMQLLYNLVQRHIESDFLPLAHTQDMAITPWSPLGGGLLTGKFDRDADSAAQEGTRMVSTPWGDRYMDDEKRTIAEGVTAIAREIGATTAQVAINWLRQNPKAVIVPIFGARNVDQLKENLNCLDFDLTADQRARLDDLSAISRGYPASLLDDPFLKKMIHGEMADRIDNHHDPR